MNTTNFLKKKFLFSIVVLLLFFVVSITVFYLESVPAFVSFGLFLFAFLFTNLSNFYYNLMIISFGKLKERDMKKEIKVFPLIFFISFLLIFLLGSMLNIPLSVYERQYSQIILLAGLFILFNEFWFLFSEVMQYNKMKKEFKKTKKSFGGEVINLVFHFFFLISFAIRLPLFDMIISLLMIGVVFGVGIYLGMKKLKG